MDGCIEETCKQEKSRLDIKTPSMDQLIKLLSGGNQQKVLVSRWLLTSPDILILDEPTRGIDVGAKAEIHKLMSKLAQDGKAIIMISSELPEILGMSDRILVMHEGKVGGIFERKAATQESIMQAATGHGLDAQARQEEITCIKVTCRRRLPMASTTTPQALGRSFNREWFNAFIRKYAIVLIFIAMFVGMTFLTDAFLHPRNLLNVVRQISVVGLIAIGVTMVIITTGIDLSSGSVLALAAVFAASLAQQPGWHDAKYPGLCFP